MVVAILGLGAPSDLSGPAPAMAVVVVITVLITERAPADESLDRE